MERSRRIIPPVWFAFALAAMVALHRFAPLGRFIELPLAWAGLAPLIGGLLMAANAAGAFRRAGTPVLPFTPSTALVTDGFYRWTRNPMYLGLALMLAGVAVLLGSWSTLLPIAVFAAIIQGNFILGEERFLEEIFGERYLAYKRSVRRWF